MIGIVIVTHGRLALELIAAAQHVVGQQAGIEAVCIGADDDMELRRQDILSAVNRVGQDSSGQITGAVILTDMFGGTPSNLAIKVMQKTKCEVIAGANLPMLIKIAPTAYRQKSSLQGVTEAAYTAGRKYINIASRVLTEQAELA